MLAVTCPRDRSVLSSSLRVKEQKFERGICLPEFKPNACNFIPMHPFVFSCNTNKRNTPPNTTF